MARLLLVVLAAVLALTVSGCGDPGRVVQKTIEGREVTGQHFIWCKRSKGTVKVLVTYKEFIETSLGDPC